MTPRLLAPLLFCFALAAHASGPERPSRADLQRALELHERSVVRVHGPRRAGPGVIVGSAGQVLTSVEHVSLEAAEVEFGGKRLPGAVVLANAYLKIAVVAAPQGSYPSVPVKAQPEDLDGKWLIGVAPGRGKQASHPFTAVARRTKEPFVDVDLPLAPGTPLFDVQGRLAAVVVQRRAGGCRALPLESVKLQLASTAGSP
ncbi:S1 family peptidase [Hyalangium rubrum]|uniref:Serine protease n=1 Tax=Hyalangium rubrum TaxID=3103134 RepID=A0ABU5GV82_9BACT|nr:serine protease [Hyalangium sp. s54d21]MDY7225079.1 serine protease [Hyalangium sp. s54d21]